MTLILTDYISPISRLSWKIKQWITNFLKKRKKTFELADNRPIPQNIQEFCIKCGKKEVFHVIQKTDVIKDGYILKCKTCKDQIYINEKLLKNMPEIQV